MRNQMTWQEKVSLIKHLMLDNDVRNKDLKHRFNITDSYVSQILVGKRPNCHLIDKFLVYLNLIDQANDIEKLSKFHVEPTKAKEVR